MNSMSMCYKNYAVVEDVFQFCGVESVPTHTLVQAFSCAPEPGAILPAAGPAGLSDSESRSVSPYDQARILPRKMGKI